MLLGLFKIIVAPIDILEEFGMEGSFLDWEVNKQRALNFLYSIGPNMPI